MNTEQLQKEFEAWRDDAIEFIRENKKRLVMADFIAEAEANFFLWEGYKAAAKSREELIRKLYGALKLALDTTKACCDCVNQSGEGEAEICNQALAEAAAQGYGG